MVLKNKKGINVFFSDLRKDGWIEVKLNQRDNRRRLYKLKTPIQGIEGIISNEN